jgi:hypothetical protein
MSGVLEYPVVTNEGLRRLNRPKEDNEIQKRNKKTPKNDSMKYRIGKSKLTRKDTIRIRRVRKDHFGSDIPGVN